MSCMCGDLYCKSCGPAQGNWQCSICGAWSAEGGCEKPQECAAQEQREAEAEAAYYEGLAAQEAEERAYWEEIARQEEEL